VDGGVGAMRDALAERLLANVMQWTPADVAEQRPKLQALAAFKYDEYQQFSPGMRFVESLALWLEQFETPNERKTAYEFVLSRLVFLSHAEMAHFAAIAYPDVIRPLFIEEAARASTLPPFRVSQVVGTDAFKQLQGSSLFFGLSDGARIDLFRRSNKELSHEQIFTGYELSDERVAEAREWLAKRGHVGVVPALVLLDDFSASGASCLTADGDRARGKVAKLIDRIQSSEVWGSVASFPKTRLIIVLYVATEQALANIQAGAEALRRAYGAEATVRPVQLISADVALKASDIHPMVDVIKKYYDPSVEDEHTRKGGSDLKFGFADGGLPVVLHHNTPNNSIFLLWVEGSETVRPLFPRVSRHRREA
jgi:hypothetical protein